MAGPQENFDVAIVGGAAMGSAVAYFLLSDPEFRGSVLVVERDGGYAAAATTRSWGGIRQQFSTDDNVRMSLFGLEFLNAASDLLEVAGDRPDVGLRRQGYLFLASPAGVATLGDNVGRQRALGADVDVLDPDELAARFPWLRTEDLGGGGLGRSGEGWFDPHALLQALRRKARTLGAAYIEDEAIGIEVAGGRITGLQLARTGRIGCGALVNAAGPWAGRVADMAGVDLPVRPRKRMTFVFDCRTDLSAAPLTVDPSGVCFRPEGGRYIAIVSPPEDADPDCDDLEEDHAPFEAVIWPALSHRVPAFEAIRPAGGWAGLYDVNTFDRNAIIGPHPEIHNLLFCNGFSGHGVQQAPAAGRAVAELIVHGRYRTLDLTGFAYDRIAAGRPVREINVV